MNVGPDDDSGGLEPARATQLLEWMRALPPNAAEARVDVVARKCEEILRRQVAAIREQSQPWSANLKAEWWEDQMAAIASTLSEVRAALPDELRKEFGNALVGDVSADIETSIDQHIASARDRCESILAAELPEAATYRAQRLAQQGHEELGEQLTEITAALSSATNAWRRAWIVAVVATVVALVAWFSR